MVGSRLLIGVQQSTTDSIWLLLWRMGHYRYGSTILFRFVDVSAVQYFLALFFTLRQIWDLQTKRSVHTLKEVNSSDTTVVVCHPRLPLIVSGTSIGFVRIWNLSTYR